MPTTSARTSKRAAGPAGQSPNASASRSQSASRTPHLRYPRLLPSLLLPPTHHRQSFNLLDSFLTDVSLTSAADRRSRCRQPLLPRERAARRSTRRAHGGARRRASLGLDKCRAARPQVGGGRHGVPRRHSNSNKQYLEKVGVEVASSAWEDTQSPGALSAPCPSFTATTFVIDACSLRFLQGGRTPSTYYRWTQIPI